MNEEKTDLDEQEKPHNHASSSSCKESTDSLFAPNVNTKPDLADQSELTMDIPVYAEPFEKFTPETSQDNAGETREHSQNMKQGKEENTLLQDFSNTKMQNSLHGTNIQTKQSSIAPVVLDDVSFTGTLDGCFNEVTAEKEDENIPLAIPQSRPVPTPQLNRISIVPRSKRDHKVWSEGLTRQDSASRRDSFSHDVSDQDIEAEEVAVSPMSSGISKISNRGKDPTQIFEIPFENSPTYPQQLFNPSRESGITKEVNAEVSNVSSVSTQMCAESKEREERCSRTFMSQPGLNRVRSQATDIQSAVNSSNPHGYMHEIDLNEDSLSPEEERKNSVSVVPQQLHIDLSKYTELLGQHNAAVTFLKRSVVKGVIAGKTKLKDVVNEKLSMASKSQETSQPDILVPGAGFEPPYCSTPNNLSTAISGAPHVEATPCISPPRSYNAQQILQHNLAAGVGNVKRAAPVAKKDNFAIATSGSGLRDIISRQLMPSAPIIHPQLNNYSTPFRSTPEGRSSFLHPAVTQTPGHVSGYGGFPPPIYGFPLPPSPTQPPPMPAMEYFANRYSASGHSIPASSPTIGISPPNIDRTHFSKIDAVGSPIIRQGNYVTSFFNMKSNKMKDSIQRKLSTSLSQTAREDLDADFFMEEGQVKISHVVNRSDQFRRRGFPLLTSDDILMGALCCCCWPLGLAARLVTLTMPVGDGPVDSCIKSMSQQLTSIALVLGMASYFVFFVMWLSLFVVTAK